MSVIGLLITGPSGKRTDFHLKVAALANHHTERGDTSHYSIFPEHVDPILLAAADADVTIQRIVSERVPTPIKAGVGTRKAYAETYPVLFLGSHGQKWEQSKYELG